MQYLAAFVRRDGQRLQQQQTAGRRRRIDVRDGRFVGYAEWPDEETWQKAFDAKMVYDDPGTRAAFVDAVAETPPGNKPAFTMTVTDDLLTLRY